MPHKHCHTCNSNPLSRIKCDHVKSCSICYLDNDVIKLACLHPPRPVDCRPISDYVRGPKRSEYIEEPIKNSKNPFYPNNSVVGLNLPSNKCMKCPYGRFLGDLKKCSLCSNEI
jgi:hypothetical protein